MPRGRIGPYPTIQFAHDLGTRSWVVGTTFRYSLQPIAIERPPQGHRTGRITCGVCGVVEEIQVLDEATARRRRLMWLGLTLAGAALFVASVGLPAELFEALRCPGLIAGVVAMLCGVKWWTEDGIRFAGKSDKLHRFDYGKAGR